MCRMWSELAKAAVALFEFMSQVRTERDCKSRKGDQVVIPADWLRLSLKLNVRVEAVDE